LAFLYWEEPRCGSVSNYSGHSPQRGNWPGDRGDSIAKFLGSSSLVNDPLQFVNTQPASGIAEISRFELAR
jgi:hypothetical protein